MRPSKKYITYLRKRKQYENSIPETEKKIEPKQLSVVYMNCAKLRM